MKMLSLEQKAFLVESYFRNGSKNENGEWSYSYHDCYMDFRERFPNVAVDFKIILETTSRSVANFRETGSVGRKTGSGRPCKRTEEVVEEVRGIIANEPSKSLRRLSQQVNLSYGTCRTILKRDLHFFPYKVHAYHQILPRDFIMRMNFCEWFLNNLDNDDILDISFYTDEAYFQLNGYVNSQNMRMWSAENPHEFIEAPLHPLKVGLWVAISRRRIFYVFFEQNVTANNYIENMLTPFVQQLHDDEITQGYFQQDKATAHTAHATIDFLRQFYDDRIIDQNLWPSHSPDISVPDFFLFSYLKNRVYQHDPQNLEELRNAISEEIETITPAIMSNVYENLKKRIRLCLQNGGQHFQHLL